MQPTQFVQEDAITSAHCRRGTALELSIPRAGCRAGIALAHFFLAPQVQHDMAGRLLLAGPPLIQNGCRLHMPATL